MNRAAQVLVAYLATVSFASAQPIVRYTFNGTALDSSGMNNHGTIVGNPPFVAGQADQAIFFDNPVGQVPATQYVSLPNSASILGLQNSSFTFALNYRSTDTTINNGRLFGRDQGPSGSAVIFNVNSGAPETYAGIRDTNGNLLDTLPVVSGNPIALTSDGQWHWGVVVLDRTAGELRQYVDTNLVATVPFSTFDSILFSDLSIGRVSFNTTFGARLTAVDEFQLFDRALSTNEVLALVPEPSSLALAGVGLSGLVVRRVWRRREHPQPDA